MKICLLVLTLTLMLQSNAQNAAIVKGNDYYKEGEYELAESQYRKAGENPVAKFNRSSALIRLKKGQEALGILQTLSKEEDLSLRANAFYNAGVVYSKAKDLESAIESYKSCLRINPSDKEARENLQKAMLELKAEQKQKSASQNKTSRITATQADQKLQALQEKERKLQKKLEGQKKGQSMENDW